MFRIKNGAVVCVVLTGLIIITQVFYSTRFTKSDTILHGLSFKVNTSVPTLQKHGLSHIRNSQVQRLNLLKSTHNYRNTTSDIQQFKRVVNPFEFNFITKPAQICKGRNVTVVFCHPSRADDLERRNILRKERKVWFANETNAACALFFLGKPTSNV